MFEIEPESEVRGKAVRAACVGWCEKRAGGERVQKTSRLLVSRLRSAKQQRLYLLMADQTSASLSGIARWRSSTRTSQSRST